MFSELDGPVIADQEISAVSKFLDDRGLVGVMRLFRSNRRGTKRLDPDQLSQIQAIRQSAVRQFSLTRPIVKQKGRKLKEKDWMD